MRGGHHLPEYGTQATVTLRRRRGDLSDSSTRVPKLRRARCKLPSMALDAKPGPTRDVGLGKPRASSHDDPAGS
jgi:hypothetical protein